MVQSRITVIPARQCVGTQKETAEKPKVRVAAYCRVSIDSDEQATSYDAQIEHYTDFIQQKLDWTLAGIYAEMKIAKMIQFKNMNPVKKGRNKGFRHSGCCQELLFFCREIEKEKARVHL